MNPVQWSCARCARKYAAPLDYCPYCAVLDEYDMEVQGQGDWEHCCPRLAGGHRVITPVGAPCVLCGTERGDARV